MVIMIVYNEKQNKIHASNQLKSPQYKWNNLYIIKCDQRITAAIKIDLKARYYIRKKKKKLCSMTLSMNTNTNSKTTANNISI
jgi:hypothetical protein